MKINSAKLVGIFLWTYLSDWLEWNLNYWFMCMSVGSFVYWSREKFVFHSVFNVSLSNLAEISPRAYLTDKPEWNFYIWFVCLSVGSFFNWKREKLHYLLNFQEFFIQMDGHFLNDLKHRLAHKIKFFYWVSLSWFIENIHWGTCSLAKL